MINYPDRPISKLSISKESIDTSIRIVSIESIDILVKYRPPLEVRRQWIEVSEGFSRRCWFQKREKVRKPGY